MRQCRVTLELQPDSMWSADLIENPTHVNGGTVSYSGEGPTPLVAMTRLVEEIYAAMTEAAEE